MTTGRINQVARKVSTPKPQGNGTQTLGQAQRSTRSAINAHKARRNTPREPHKDRPTVQSNANQSRQAQTTTAVTDQTSLAATCGETDQHTTGAPIRTRLCETSCNTNQTKESIQSPIGTSRATSLHSEVPMLSAQTAQHQPHRQAQAIDEATIIEAIEC